MSVESMKSEIEKAEKELAESIKTNDSFVNFAHNMGIGADNPMTTSSYGFNPITRNRTLLEWIHRGSWIGGIAVDTVADDMTRAGVSMHGQIDPDDISLIEEKAVTLNIWGSINEGIKWSRLYGGAIVVMLVDGQDNETPLRLNTIRKNQFCGLLVLDRWMIEPSLNELITDYGPNLGMPKYYRVTGQALALSGQKIHHSRCIRLEGVKLPYWQRIMENLWGLSVLERLYDRMIAFDSATTGAAQLVFKSYLRTYKIKDLREVVATGGTALEGLARYVDMMRQYQGIEGITLLDAEDEFAADSHGAFSGLSDALVQFGQQISGALQIPLVRLFGQSPAGFSSGDTDLRNYYDTIKQQQEFALKVGITKIYRAIGASLGIDVQDGFEVKFNDLWQLTDSEKGDIATKTFDVVSRAEESALIDKATALKELKQSSRLTGIFTNITDEMIEEAANEPPPMPETMDPTMDPNQPQQLNGAENDIQPAGEDRGDNDRNSTEPLDNPRRDESGKGSQKDAAIRAAGVCLLDQKGQILLTLRSDANDDHTGEWAFPGGKIEIGETAIQAAIRELKEETGLSINEGYIQPSVSQMQNGFIGFITKPAAYRGLIKLNDENDSFKWVSPDKLPSPMHPDAELMVKEWFSK